MSEKKRGPLQDWLGLENDLADRLVSPWDMAADGLASIGTATSGVLRPLGAKLDAKIGTTPYRDDEASPDVFANRPESDPIRPGAPLQRMGLFETLGHAVPQIGAAVLGNHGAMMSGGPSAPSVAAFPTPKQSFKAMQEHAMVRDALESKGLREIELPREPAPMEFQRQQRAAREAGLTTERLRPGAPRYGATPAAESRAFSAQDSADRVGEVSGANFLKQQEEAAARGAEIPPFQNDWRDVSQDSFNAAARPAMYRGQMHYAAHDEIPHASAPVGLRGDPKVERGLPSSAVVVEPGQSELERYIAGISGPRSGGDSLAMFPSPKESFRRMKEEAVFRDALESKGALREVVPEVIEDTAGMEGALARGHVSNFGKSAAAVDSGPRAASLPPPVNPKGYTLETSTPYDVMTANFESPHAMRQRYAEGFNNGARLGHMHDRPPAMRSPDGPGPDFYGIRENLDGVAHGASGGLPLSAPNPRAKIPAGQSELERYLAGLYGPKAPGAFEGALQKAGFKPGDQMNGHVLARPDGTKTYARVGKDLDGREFYSIRRVGPDGKAIASRTTEDLDEAQRLATSDFANDVSPAAKARRETFDALRNRMDPKAK